MNKNSLLKESFENVSQSLRISDSIPSHIAFKMSTKMDLYNDHLKRNHTEQGVTSNVCKLSFYIMGMLFSLILLIQKSEVNFVWISPKELTVSFIMILLFFSVTVIIHGSRQGQLKV